MEPCSNCKANKHVNRARHSCIRHTLCIHLAGKLRHMPLLAVHVSNGKTAGTASEGGCVIAGHANDTGQDAKRCSKQASNLHKTCPCKHITPMPMRHTKAHASVQSTHEPCSQANQAGRLHISCRTGASCTHHCKQLQHAMWLTASIACRYAASSNPVPSRQSGASQMLWLPQLRSG